MNKFVVQLMSAAFEHSMLHVPEICALENVVFYIVVYGAYKPYISSICNTECSNAPEIRGCRSEVKLLRGAGN